MAFRSRRDSRGSGDGDRRIRVGAREGVDASPYFRRRGGDPALRGDRRRAALGAAIERDPLTMAAVVRAWLYRGGTRDRTAALVAARPRTVRVRGRRDS